MRLTHLTAPVKAILLAGAVAFPALAETPVGPPAPDPDKPALRPTEDHRGIFSFSFENDVFAADDNHYTNGVRASFLSAENHMPGWLESVADSLPGMSPEGRKRWGVAAGQSMYTPNDISISPPDPTDQPYAGWLYGSVTLHSDSGHRLDTWQLTAGMVGPSSKAAEVQDFVHDMIGSTDPQGWDYQLRDEPGIILSYERKWRGLAQFSPFGLGADITPSIGGSIGNVFTHANVGAVARIGYDLPADYGPPLIRPNLSGSDFFVPSKRFGWYLFAGLEGRAVARNIFLDGNTFRDSPSVDKEIFIGGAQLGAALTFGNTRLAYTHIMRTPEFEGQDGIEEFGAVTLSYRF